MSLFDIVKDKVGELFSGAGEKVSELTGVDLPGSETADQLTQSAGNLSDTAATAGQDLTETTQGLTDSATGAVQDFTGTASDAVTDVTDPRK